MELVLAIAFSALVGANGGPAIAIDQSMYDVASDEMDAHTSDLQAQMMDFCKSAIGYIESQPRDGCEEFLKLCISEQYRNYR